MYVSAWMWLSYCVLVAIEYDSAQGTAAFQFVQSQQPTNNTKTNKQPTTNQQTTQKQTNKHYTNKQTLHKQTNNITPTNKQHKHKQTNNKHQQRLQPIRSIEASSNTNGNKRSSWAISTSCNHSCCGVALVQHHNKSIQSINPINQSITTYDNFILLTDQSSIIINRSLALVVVLFATNAQSNLLLFASKRSCAGL